ncbi:MAG: glycosyltransferase family 2 protein [Patescibacteria group bacterium]
MESIPLSVIIPVSNDIKIKKCLSSVEGNPEIIVVLNNNPSKEVIDTTKEDKRCIPVFLTAKGCNLAQVINIGVQKAKNEKIVIMNSDCVFPNKILSKINFNLDRFDVVKARLSFLHNTFSESLVAKVRYLYSHIFNNQKNIFGPGMAFNKRIIEKVGGYLFDEDMGWGEDSDLSRRIYKAQLSFLFMEEEIVHLPESVWHDLKIAVRIGRGKRIRDYKDSISFLMGATNLFYSIILDRYRHIRLSLKHYGLLVTIYLLIWKAFYFAGYFYFINSKNLGKLWIKTKAS